MYHTVSGYGISGVYETGRFALPLSETVRAGYTIFMLEFRQRQKRRRVLSSNLTILVLCVLVVLLGKETWDVYVKERKAAELLERVQVQQRNLNERAEFLESEIALLKDAGGVEGKLRERFGIAKPGEKVIVLVDTEATSSLQKTETGFWEKVFSWFR